LNSPANILSVSCAIIEHQGMVLVAQRGKKSTNAGKWEFPGGKIEPGENAAQCLHREIMEELSVPIVILEQLPSVIHHYPDKVITLHPFVCTYNGSPFVLAEHDGITWKLANELCIMDFSAADIKVCHYYVKKYLPEKNSRKA
jgi:8-oxo-dGTP diphosphatase